MLDEGKLFILCLLQICLSAFVNAPAAAAATQQLQIYQTFTVTQGQRYRETHTEYYDDGLFWSIKKYQQHTQYGLELKLPSLIFHNNWTLPVVWWINGQREAKGKGDGVEIGFSSLFSIDVHYFPRFKDF